MTTNLSHGQGLACEECRRRKSKCDRGRPKCGNCIETRSECVIAADSRKRGPKKGQLQALRARIATLENQLQDRYGDNEKATTKSSHTSQHSNNTEDEIQMEGLVDMLVNPADILADQVDILGEPADMLVDPADELQWLDCGSVLEGEICQSLMSPPVSTCTITNRDQVLSHSELAELQQVFFERVYPWAPIIHKGRYLARANQGEEDLSAHAGLRYAMCTIAAASSPLSRRLVQGLYTSTKKRLYELEDDGSRLPWPVGDTQLEEIQAWLLLTLYEYMQMERAQVIRTASHVFRLVQKSRSLHDMDVCSVPEEIEVGQASVQGQKFALQEEKRRSFWFAFCLARMLSAKDDESSWALREETVRLRIPAPEADFQRSQPVRVSFLSEAIGQRSANALSPFAYYVALSTLYGRCVTHRCLTFAALPSSTVVTDAPRLRRLKEFWARHNWLADAISNPERPVQASACQAVDGDPMTIVTNLLAQSIVIHLDDTLHMWPWHTAEHQETMQAWRQRALLAANDMVRLAQGLSSFDCLKAHPFLPDLLSNAIVFLNKQDAIQGVSKRTWDSEGLCRTLGNMEETHRTAKELIDQLQGNGTVF